MHLLQGRRFSVRRVQPDVPCLYTYHMKANSITRKLKMTYPFTRLLAYTNDPKILAGPRKNSEKSCGHLIFFFFNELEAKILQTCCKCQYERTHALSLTISVVHLKKSGKIGFWSQIGHPSVPILPDFSRYTTIIKRGKKQNSSCC